MHSGAPLLILAGAGSGKTRVITTKIAYLIKNKGFQPRSILAVTFTNKAADEMRARAASVAESAQHVMIKTFHSFGAWLLRRNAPLLGLDRDFRIYDDDDVCSLLRDIMPRGTPRAELKRVATMISRAKDFCLSPDGDLSRISLNEDFRTTYEQYQQRLRSIGNTDFGDLIMLSAELLQSCPEVKQRTQQRFRAILVDEYQDSNVAQFKLLKALHGDETYLCVVGDEDQSIYAFRGAQIDNILSFQQLFPGTKVIRLEENYRSTRTILDIASTVVQKNSRRLGKKLFTRRESSDPVVVACLRSQDHEAQFCARLLEDGELGQTAILYRMNSQSRAFEELFARLGIPYRVVGTTRFYEREEIRDALAYMSLVLNARDEVSFKRIVNKPSRGIGSKTVERIAAEMDTDTGNIIEAAQRVVSQLSTRAARGVESFLGIIIKLTSGLQSPSLAEFMRCVVEETGLYQHYSERDEAEGTFRAANLEELVNAGIEYAGGSEGLAGLLENILLSDSSQNAQIDDERVTLITLHNTKGLEFDRVIITGLEEGIFPHRSSSTDEDELEEERRLFYVGITRAKDSLFLTWCRERRMFGRREYQYPSRFLREIPQAAVHFYEDAY